MAQAGADMLQMQVIWRAHHEQVEAARVDQRLHGVMRDARRDAGGKQPGQAGGGGIVIADHGEIRVRGKEATRDRGHAKAQTDDGDLHGAAPSGNSRRVLRPR